MPYKDMPLTCRACGATFIFTAGEQEFFADKGFLHEPTRCPRCRNTRGNSSAEREQPAFSERADRQKQG
ncbi:MAG: zinc-ribbon domain-containing protein [Chloroflexaceae bacterium]|nr:zinc-ribbon domain-containing protein [Chloroflexaceae bacterium]